MHKATIVIVAIAGTLVWSLPRQTEKLRRSRELTHFRSVKITHLKNMMSV